MLAGLPWLVMVSPQAGWKAVRETGSPLWPAFGTQLLLLLIGWIMAARPMAELSEASGLLGDRPGFGEAVTVGVMLAALTAILALALYGLLRATGHAASFRDVLAWLVYGMTPVYLGRCLGLLSFAVFQPLAKSPQDAAALQVNPLGLSLAGLFEPLSLPWLLAASFDAFSLWALALLALGAVHYLRLGVARAGALLVALLLIWLLALTAAWQGLQRSL